MSISTIQQIRTSYRTLLRDLVHLPDIEIQQYYRDRYRTTCRKAGSACREDYGIRETRYLSLLRQETRRLEAIRNVLDDQCTSELNRREKRAERKYGLRSYARMVDQTYARAGKRRWEMLDAIYPPSSRLPPDQRSPPPEIPPHLVPLTRTVNLTAQQHRDRSLRERYGSEEYLAWIARKRAWNVHSKFLRGCAVPLEISEDVGRAIPVIRDGGQGKEVEEWSVRGERLIRSARKLATDGTRSPVGSVKALVAPSLGNSSITYRVPRTIRRIYERMLAEVPALQATLAGNGSRKWSLARKKGWEPPEASEEDKRWIVGLP